MTLAAFIYVPIEG